MKWKAILACVLWGSAFAGAKIGFQYAEPIFLSGLRFTLAGMLLIPIMLINKIDIRKELKNWRFMLIFAFIQTFLQYGLFFMGLNKVPAAISSIIVGAGPLFVAVVAHLTLKNDKMTPRKVSAILLGLSGIVFISTSKGDMSVENTSFYIGVGLLLLSNIVGSFTNIMVIKKKGAKISPVALTSFANFTGGIMLLITSFIIERPEIKFYPIEFYGALLWLSIISAASFSLWYSELQKPGVKVSELNMLKFIIPVTGSILSWILIAGEQPSTTTVTGILIITMALMLQQMPEGFMGNLFRRIRTLKA